MTQAIVTSAICRAKARKAMDGQHPSVLASNLPTLEKMLWGGTVVLLVDHAIHGELFSFSLRELLTVGVPMSVILTAIWAGWSFYQSRKKKTVLEVQ